MDIFCCMYVKIWTLQKGVLCDMLLLFLALLVLLVLKSAINQDSLQSDRDCEFTAATPVFGTNCMFLNRNVTVLFSNSTPDINEKIFFPRCISMHTHKGWSGDATTHRAVHIAHLSSQSGIYPQTAGIRHFNGSQRGFHGYSMYRNEKGDPRLGPGSQQGQIYISTRAVKTPPPLLPFLLWHNGPCISTLPTSPHTLPKKHFHHHFVLLPHTALAHCHTQRVFLGAKLLCSLL